MELIALCNPYITLWLVVVTLWLIVVESAFYGWFRCALSKAQQRNEPPKTSMKEREWLWDKMNGREDFPSILCGWFRSSTVEQVAIEHLNRRNFRELTAATMFFQNYDELEASDKQWIEVALNKFCAKHNLILSSVPNDYVVMNYILDPVVAAWRPLLFYFAVWFSNICSHLYLRLIGFKRGSSHGVSYWARCSTEEDPLITPESMVLFHGVGIGILSYTPLLPGIHAQNQFIFESPSVSMDPFASSIRSADFVQCVAATLKKHDVQQATFVGHSFGSVQCAWMLRQEPTLVRRLVLLDPVALLLCYSDVCFNFLYRKHATLNGKVISQMASMELGISRSIRRHFWWSESVLFTDMLPPTSVVLLSEYDQIVPTMKIYVDVCKHPSVGCSVMSEMGHGCGLMHRSKRRAMVDAINGDPIRESDLRSNKFK